MRKLCSIEEVAAKARRCSLTVWRAVRGGQLPSVRRGRRVFVYAAEAAAWIRDGACTKPITPNTPSAPSAPSA